MSKPSSQVAYQILSKRSEFLAAAQARRQGTPGFLLQARARPVEAPAPAVQSDAENDAQGAGLAEKSSANLGAVRVGFTCSKKVGNAVARNRAKRRLREIARMVLSAEGRPGWDYVLVGRKDETANRNFELMLADLRSALARVHR